MTPPLIVFQQQHVDYKTQQMVTSLKKKKKKEQVKQEEKYMEY